MSQRLALFDLDNTLLGGDSDHAWGEFLISESLVDATEHRAANDQFYQQYLQGKLDIHGYVKFTLQPIMNFSPEQLDSLHGKFMAEVVEPMMLEQGKELIAQHKQAGDYCLIITATNSFITTPIAQALGIETLLATDLQKHNGKFTGAIAGIPCYQNGKVEKLAQWQAAHLPDSTLDTASFYTDSINDLPLMEKVGSPVAVDPDAALEKAAKENNWRIISLRS